MSDALRYTYSRDAVGLAAVDNGGSLRAVGGVGSDDLGGDTGGDSTDDTSSESSDRETHFDIVGVSKNIRLKIKLRRMS